MVPTQEEYIELRREAQLRVRLGQSQRSIARRLGVDLSTIIRWAAEDGFRLKDIEAERLTGVRAPLPLFLERDRARRSGATVLPAEIAERWTAAEEAKAEAMTNQVEKLSAPGGPLSPPEIDPEGAARRATARAEELAEEGLLEQAERAARLAERFLRLKAKMSVIGAVPGPGGRLTDGNGKWHPSTYANEPMPDREKVLAEIIAIRERLENKYGLR
ncbi:MAG: hypothetical protein SGJ21_12595 [Alphaproteobacteria bacterium]|nr:hypothetical protein [Alphaproteobacteria bacterium]